MSEPKTSEVDPAKCVICAEDGSNKLVKDKGFTTMMTSFWSACRIDTKPHEIPTHDLCEPCFTQILNFYDMDDAATGIEQRIQKLTKNLLKKSVQGARKLSEDNSPRVGVQEKIFEQFGEIILNAGESDEDENGYQIEVNVEQPGSGGRRGRSSLTNTGFTSNARKSAESSEDFSSKSASTSPEDQQPKKRPRRQAATRGAKKVKEDESDEEDVYSSGDEDEEEEEAKNNGSDEKDDEDFSGSGSESKSESSEAESDPESP